MFIGEVARKTNLSVKAIRFYEEKELIVPPKRQGKYRVYTNEHIEVLRLIAEAKLLGVTLAELKGFIKYENGKANWAEISEFLVHLKARLQAQIEQTEQKIAKIDSCVGIINAK
ncbi:MerR family transcriptional regulator [Pseudoalteromonas sp.]|uniref:MerR family transcriptional regulator n=1 Tax=Pseudoalteromonas sp. TaxID=53249 RepID=UPI0026378D3B|nr:MerR family transcriptional regulator [Pseudoalteromonas sp.]MCP4587297.1 MerR family transcriptional regulator [Pseudoalteromonas sp.]